MSIRYFRHSPPAQAGREHMAGLSTAAPRATRPGAVVERRYRRDGRYSESSSSEAHVRDLLEKGILTEITREEFDRLLREATGKEARTP